jgi:hypothetical protein
MSDRLRSLQRIAALQAQRRRLAEWNLTALDRQRADIERAQRDLDDFMADTVLAAPLARVALAQGRRLAERDAAAAQERVRLAGLLQAAERRHKLAERIVDAVAADERAATERQTLEQLIDVMMAHDAAQP